jgi:hypothetical protein
MNGDGVNWRCRAVERAEPVAGGAIGNEAHIDAGHQRWLEEACAIRYVMRGRLEGTHRDQGTVQYLHDPGPLVRSSFPFPFTTLLRGAITSFFGMPAVSCVKVL